MATSISVWPFSPSAITSTRLFRIHYENGLKQPYISCVENAQDERAKGHLVSIDFTQEQLDVLKVCLSHFYSTKAKLTLYRGIRLVILLPKHCAALSMVKSVAPTKLLRYHTSADLQTRSYDS